MIFKPKNQVMLYGNVAWAIHNLVSLGVSVLTALKKYKVHHFKRENSKYKNWGITVLAAALRKGLRVTTQQ